ncbi:MAG: Rrf2 family transcriptional regulator [Actinobacteria bacterium]|nr:Rrf2 family transcriptional regulator [Actinomycetota bacterium]
MKISTKGRYGLRALLDLATNYNGQYIALKTIAKRLEVSEDYLEQVFSILRKANLVKSIKGSQGGYTLTNDPSKMTIGSILRTLEGDLSVVNNTIDEKKYDNAVDYCLKINVWDKINKNVNRLIESMTLEDLVNKYKIINHDNSPMFYI